MTGSKNQKLLTVTDLFSRLPFVFLLRNIALIASSNDLRHFLPSSEPQGSFTPTGADCSCLRSSKTSDAKMMMRPQKLRPTIQGNGQNEGYNGMAWKAVQRLLHSTNRPFSDRECVKSSELSSIRTLRLFVVLS